MQPRKRFLLYNDWENLIQDMSDSDIASLTRGVFKYQNTGEIMEMTYGAKLAFSFMRPVFDEDRKDWEEIKKKNSDNAKERWKKRNDATACDRIQSDANECEQMRSSTDIGIDSVIGIDIVTEIKETNDTIVSGEQALDCVEKLEEKKEYGNKEINQTLLFLQKHIGCDTFAESQKLQRQYAKHILNLGKKIGSEEMKYRLEEILSDRFKAKNANKLAYMYKELKSFIHAPEKEIASF